MLITGLQVVRQSGSTEESTGMSKGKRGTDRTPVHGSPHQGTSQEPRKQRENRNKSDTNSISDEA